MRTESQWPPMERYGFCAHVARTSRRTDRDEGTSGAVGHTDYGRVGGNEGSRMARRGHTQIKHARSVIPDWDHCASWSVAGINEWDGEKVWWRVGVFWGGQWRSNVERRARAVEILRRKQRSSG